MPFMNGIQCTEEIKKLLRNAQVSHHTKFLAVSGLTLDSYKEIYKSSPTQTFDGFCKYLSITHLLLFS